jgi:hypothetical protein
MSGCTSISLIDDTDQADRFTGNRIKNGSDSDLADLFFKRALLRRFL